MAVNSQVRNRDGESRLKAITQRRNSRLVLCHLEAPKPAGFAEARSTRDIRGSLGSPDEAGDLGPQVSDRAYQSANALGP